MQTPAVGGARVAVKRGRAARSLPRALLALLFALPVMAPLHAQISLSNAELCSDQSSPDVVIGACTSLIESGLLPPQLMAEVLTRRGQGFYVSGQYPAALADFLRAVSLVPARADYHRNVGDARANLLRNSSDVLAVTVQLEKAVEDLTRAVQLDPKDAVNLIHRGVVYVSLGRVERGLDDLNQAVALAPESAAPYEARARAYNAAGAFQRAVADCDTALRLQPGLANALFSRGIAYDGLEDYDRAIEDFTEVARLYPKGGSGAYNNRGMSYAKRGQTDRAIEDFDEALALDPNLAGAYFNRGQAYYLKGNMDRALADFVQARQLDSRFPEPPTDIYETYDAQVDPDDSPVRAGRRRPFGN